MRIACRHSSIFRTESANKVTREPRRAMHRRINFLNYGRAANLHELCASGKGGFRFACNLRLILIFEVMLLHFPVESRAAYSKLARHAGHLSVIKGQSEFDRLCL